MSKSQLSVPQLSQQGEARFWSKVQQGEAAACWPWTGAKSKAGHGRFKVGGDTYYAHRVSFAMRWGDSPNYLICHRCDNPACVNPEHLYDETHLENSIEASNRGRLNRPSRKSKKKGKPAKPYPDFPLFPHATKRWAKKIRGKMYYFGPWDDPKGAEDKFNRQKADLYAGRRPVNPNDVFHVEALVNKFLAYKQARIDSGELSQRTFKEYSATCQRIIDEFKWDTAVADLRPEDFERYRVKVSKSIGPVRLGNEVQRVRSLFKFAFDDGRIDRPVRFGPGFKRPSKKTLRLHRAARGSKMFESTEIHQMLKAAGPQLRAMILLGINCGFGNHDCGMLPFSALDLAGAWVNYPRPKTGIDRRAKLWPETIEAIRRAIETRPMPKDDAHANLVFVTKYGLPWAKEIADSPITKETRKILDELGIDGYRNFYCLRHSFETIAGGSRDQVAVDAIMGHADESMAAHYREGIGDDRLEAVASHVRNWLWAYSDHIRSWLFRTNGVTTNTANSELP